MDSAGQRSLRELASARVKVVFRKVPNYIVKARASYQLQRGVPSDCQPQVGKKKWKEPGGKTLNEARARVPGFITRTNLEIRQARGEQLTPEERLIQTGQVDGLSAMELAELTAPHVGQYLDDGSPDPAFEHVLAVAQQVQEGKARELLSVEGLLQARFNERDPSPRTFEGWVKALEGFMAFSEKPRPFNCTKADALAYRDHLLTRMGRSTAKTQLAYLAGLWTTLVAKQGGGEHIFKGLPGTLDETTKSKAQRASTAKRFKVFEPSSPWNSWEGSVYVPVFRLMYFTGCRLAEIAGLRAVDIHGDHISVEWTDDRSLKTANSVRDIPLHPLLKPVVEPLRQHTGHIWPSLQSYKKVQGVEVVRWGHNLSKPCKQITGLRPKDFRDRAIGQLRSNGFNDTLIQRLSGHSAVTVNSSYGGADWDSYCRMIQSLS